jgi:signal transduction histidine kinase
MKLIFISHYIVLHCHIQSFTMNFQELFSNISFQSLLIISVLFIITVIFFIIREQAIKKQTRKLSVNLDQKTSDLIIRENNMLSLRNEIENQIKYCDDQSEFIHTQTIELDKDRHQLEKTIESKTFELKIAKEKAEESDKLKSSFLENISHEVRTPMNAIMGFASLLSDPDVDSTSRAKYISRINKNCLVLLQLIDDILIMSRIHAEQLIIKKEKFSVNEVMLSIFKTFKEEKEELELTKIELVLDLPDKSFYLFSDVVRFKQVLSKLISNALKYTEKGKIEFGYKPVYKSEFEKEPNFLQFKVRDTGIGIAQSKLDFIFSRFSKIESDKNRLYRGAGLGLYISKNLVELMGGQIWVQSKVNEGSTFNFSLPYFEINKDEDKSLKKKKTYLEKLTAITYNWKNKTILVVEDELNNFILLNEILKRTGASVIEAKNGFQAIEEVRKHPEINVVLMDLLMPKMDGYEATKTIKNLCPRLPVIAQTAYTLPKEKEKSLEAGCDGYICKPYNPPELLELINNFI